MQVYILNQSSIRVPRKYLLQGSLVFLRALKRREPIVWSKANELSVVFLDTDAARKLNRQYRKRDYPTDVLSFSGQGDLLGELVLCPQVLRAQAKEQRHSFRQETLYMIIHGVLHLLGFDHEKSQKDAEKMFSLQDELYRIALEKLES